MSVNIKTPTGLVRVAGRGRAEYGASTVRTGMITTEEIGIGSFAVFTVTFDKPMPDSNYRITWDWNTAGGNITFAIVTITEKTANGFKLYVRNSDVTANPLTSHVLTWYAFKLYTDTEYNSVLALEDRVETLETLTNEAELSTMPLAKFQIGSGGAVGYADLGATTTTISQAFSWLEVEYGRVDGFIDKYFISVAGSSINLNYIRVVRLTNYGQTPTITLDANKHIWMSMDTYVYIRVKAYGNFSISGTLSRTAPTGTTIPINGLITENEINPTLTATFTAANGLKSGGVTVQGCKKIGDGLAVVTGYINKNTVLTVNGPQSNLGGLGITNHTSVGTNPTSLFLWSQDANPQCVSSVWKTTGSWIAVPWESGDYTLSEDAWFNAVIRYI